MIATDAEGRVRFLNAVAQHLTGWSDEEALDRPLAEVFHIINEQSRERCEDPVAEADAVRGRGGIGKPHGPRQQGRNGAQLPTAPRPFPAKTAGSSAWSWYSGTCASRNARGGIAAQRGPAAGLDAVEPDEPGFLQQITDFVLESAVALTNSKIGYLAFMNEDESVLTMHSWSKSAMQQCAIIDKPIVYAVVNTGLWGEAVRQRRPVITNDYQAPNPLKKGHPEGHVKVLRHMNAPTSTASGS